MILYKGLVFESTKNWLTGKSSNVYLHILSSRFEQIDLQNPNIEPEREKQNSQRDSLSTCMSTFLLQNQRILLLRVVYDQRQSFVLKNSRELEPG